MPEPGGALDEAALRQVELVPGGGALYLIGREAAWQRHQEWSDGVTD